MANETLEDLLIEEAKVVFKYLVKMGASKEDAEDIIQDTLFKTMENIDGIDGSKIRAWLFKVAINHYYNLYNKNKKTSPITSEKLDELVMPEQSPEEQYLTQEKVKGIYQVLNQLKPTYRNLIIFKYFMELSYKEIANIMELNEQKVKVYLYRARNKFKEIWEGNHVGQK